MRVLFINIPNTRRVDGRVAAVGPQAGSRWPWTGMTPGCYAPYPFYLGFCVTYLQAHGIEADIFDGVAEQAWFPELWQERPNIGAADIVVYEISMPVAQDVLEEARKTHTRGKKVVLCGPHCAYAGEELAALPYVDHVIIGEYEIPMLKICGGDKAKVFRYEHVEDLDHVNGKVWHPFRDWRVMAEYYEPTVNTPKVQLTVMTSRGCFAKCSYCAWPKTMNNRTYRARSAEVVLDEITTAIFDAPKSGRKLGQTWMRAEKNNPNQQALVRSILFDDDTAFIGVPRTRALCDGLKNLNLPWSAMTRLDIHKPEIYDLMFDSGAVAIRAGVESFQQHVVDRTNGSRDCKKQYDALHYIAGRYRNIEIHLTSMRDMPGQTEADWIKDQDTFRELQARAEAHGNAFHWQISRTMPFPGTDLYNQMVAAGHGEALAKADYNGTTEDPGLNKLVREFVPLSVKGKA